MDVITACCTQRLVKKRTFRPPAFNDLLNLPRMVVNPFRNRVQFVVETLLLSGTTARLTVAAGIVALVAMCFGLLGFALAGNAHAAVSNPWDAIWWAFLRLSDPGYLGDDQGAVLRTLSTILTVAGYVLFLGVLVAVLTQGLNEWIRRLEMGLSPISARQHVILLGWSNRLPGIVRNLMISEQRVKRFLRRIGARRLKLVLLVNEVTPHHTAELRAHLGGGWRSRDLILRSGSPLRLDHLKRVDYLQASTIVLPAEDRSTGHSAAQSDNAAIKTVLAIAHSMRIAAADRSPPLLVTELYDARKIPIALHSYRGPIEVVATDEVVSRMVAQMVRHPQISHVYRELLTPASGNEIYARDCPTELAGTPFWRLAASMTEAILIGVVRPPDEGKPPLLDPPHDHLLCAGDKLVFVARDWDAGAVLAEGPVPDWPAPMRTISPRLAAVHRVLVLGWSRRVPALLAELENYDQEQFHVTIASRLDLAARERAIADYGRSLARVRVLQVDADYTVPDRLAALAPGEFDTVLALASDLTESDEEADARSLVAHAVLQDLLPPPGSPGRPRVLLELLDDLNLALVDNQDCECLLSPAILSHILVQVALRRELNLVFQELFDSGQTEITFRPIESLGWQPGATVSLPELQVRAREQGEVALGYLRAAEHSEPHGGVHLNPARDTTWTVGPGDACIVLSR